MSRPRSTHGAGALTALLAVVAAVLIIGAALLLAVQERQRRELRDRYADRIVVAGTLLDSVLRASLVGETTRLTDRLGGRRVRTAALDRLARSNEARWSAVVDSRGRILATSSRGGPDARGRLARENAVARAFSGADYGLGDIDRGLLATATRFPAKSAAEGSRAYVSWAPPASLSRFLEGSLGPLPGVRRARAYIIDGNGVPIAGLARERSALPQQIERLVGALDQAPRGSFTSEGTRRFYASQPISRSRWTLAVTVPEDVLYASVSGPSRWLPWVILLAAAGAVTGVALLLRRLLAATRALRQANADLERSNAQLAETNAELEQFASVASTGLSEPLRSVSGFGRALQDRYGGRLGADADVYMDHLVGAVTRMQQLIDDLLAFARISRSRVDVRPVDLDQVLEEVLQSIDSAIDARGARVITEPLPEVLGERNKLGQVLQNLVVNAIKFTAPDVTPRIHVSAESTGSMARIIVRDNGIGIPPEHRAHIFTMFGRLHPSDRYPGTGIGLAVVHRIIERHGGTISIDDAPGGGSIFSFTLPPAAPDEAARMEQPVSA